MQAASEVKSYIRAHYSVPMPLMTITITRKQPVDFGMDSSDVRYRTIANGPDRKHLISEKATSLTALWLLFCGTAHTD